MTTTTTTQADLVEFTEGFRDEHRAGRDTFLEIGHALRQRDRARIGDLMARANTLIGPHMFNFAAASDAAVAAGAALQVRDADQLFAVAARLLDDGIERERIRAAALAFIAAHRGAIDRLWRWVEPRLR